MGLLISDNYKGMLFGLYHLVDTSILYFVFEDFIRTYYMTPNKGHIGGGNIINATGNYSYFGKNNFTLYLGQNLISPEDIISVSQTNIVFIVPPVQAPQIVNLYIVYGGVTFMNESAPYYYKNYSILLSMDPPIGPTQGGT
jgi:hypothetical protein